MHAPGSAALDSTSAAAARGGYVFAGGGTGGHLFPAIAVAESLRAREPQCGVLFVGTEREQERRIVADAGFEHLALPLLPRSQGWRHPLQFASALWRSCQLMHRSWEAQRPRVVVGCGGWSSFPAVWGARQAGIPIVLLEQNVLPGKGTRRLSRWADAVCLSFEESRQWLRPSVETVVTGNPVRRQVAELWTANEEGLTAGGSEAGGAGGRSTLLVLGGSLGSQRLNQGVLAGIASAPERWRCWEIVHQTGPDDCERVRAEYSRLGIPARVEAFCTDVPRLLSRATVVISRAGATTLAELACAGAATVVVPWRGAADDHQRLNAEWYAARKAMELGDEAGGFWERAVALADDPALRTGLRGALRSTAKPQATEEVLRVMDAMASRRVR